MDGKLKQIDLVIEEIFNRIVSANKLHNSLIVLTADHGMTNEGRHGANSLTETLVPLIFMDTRANHTFKSAISSKAVKQIDIASTISVLMSYTPPKVSKGRLIKKVLDSFGLQQQQQSCAYFANALQMVNFVNPEKDEHHFYRKFQDITNQHYQALNKSNEMLTNATIAKYDRLLLDIQSQIAFDPKPPNVLWVSIAVLIALASIIMLLVPQITDNLPNLNIVMSRPWIFGLFSLLVTPLVVSFTTSFTQAENQYWGKLVLCKRTSLRHYE